MVCVCVSWIQKMCFLFFDTFFFVIKNPLVNENFQFSNYIILPPHRCGASTFRLNNMISCPGLSKTFAGFEVCSCPSECPLELFISLPSAVCVVTSENLVVYPICLFTTDHLKSQQYGTSTLGLFPARLSETSPPTSWCNIQRISAQTFGNRLSKAHLGVRHPRRLQRSEHNP